MLDADHFFSENTREKATKMKLWTAAVLAALIWLDGTPNAIAAPSGFEDNQIFNEQALTIDLVFTPQEELLVVQKPGYVNVYEDPDGDYSYKRKTLALDITDIVCDNQERALGGIQVHPDFGVSNRYIYLYYTYNKNGNCNQDANNGPVNRFSRFVLPESFQIDRNSETVLFETPSLFEAVHNAGKIEFGKDRYIYVTIGESQVPDEAQSLKSLLGGMVRLTEEGGIPPDNPFAQDPNGVRCNENGRPPSGSSSDAKCQELYAIGLRNPFRFAMDPNTEGNKVRYYINDVGASMWEEISEGGDDFRDSQDYNGIANYGWPIREGPCRRETTTNCDDHDGYNHPVHYYFHPDAGAAATGGAFIPNGIWPFEYDNGYLYSDFVSGMIYLLQDSGKDDCYVCNPAESRMDVSDFTASNYVMAMRFGPYIGGTVALYYLSLDNGGQMRRVHYAGGLVNESPEAVVETDVLSVEVGGTVSFSGATSSDPDGDALSFEWDFDGDGVIDSYREEDSFTYDASGIYEATLTVRDGRGGQSTASINILSGTPQTGGYPGELFLWMSGDTCPLGYDFCGMLEFCQGENSKIYGYRLPCAEAVCECPGISGPLIRLVPGNKYRLTLRNAASEVTNLHTHGLHIVGDGDGDDVIRQVSGGGNCLDYTWDISSDHPGGTYWYHAHHHGLTEKQVGGGAFGLLIVEDNTNLNSVLPSWAKNERLLQVLWTANSVIGNGKTDEVIGMAASQWYRLRVSFISVYGVPLNFTFADQGSCEIHKVATDGIWRSEVPGPKASIFEMTGASRADFAIRCNTSDFLVPLYYGEGLAATIWVGPTEPNPDYMDVWHPVRPYALQDLSTSVVPNGNTLTIRLSYDQVNYTQWDPFVAIATIGYDQVHEWTMEGTSGHPFHIHLYHVQIVTPGGCGAHEEGEFYDTVSAPDDCVVRFRTADFGQRCVLHCHVLFHEDNGSMAWVNVTGTGMPRNDVQSFEYTCPATKRATPWEGTSHPLMQQSVPTEPVPQPGSAPTTKPGSGPTVEPAAEPASCKLSAILGTNEIISAGQAIQSPQLDRYLVQQNDGNLLMMQGTPDSPGEIVWQSGVAETPGDFYTTLQGDGNLLTRPGTPDNVLTSVWKSNSIGEIADYFLALNCDGASISIYKGTPDAPGNAVWTEPNEMPVLVEPIAQDAVVTLSAQCQPAALLISGESISINQTQGTNVYIEQEDDGNLVLKQVTPETPEVLWQTGVSESQGDFFTTLQGDGNMITWPGTPDSPTGSSVWMSTSEGEITQYFLGLNCENGKSVSIYKGTPETPGAEVWTSNAAIA